MKKIILISIFILTFFNANAQTLIGTKESFKPYKSYLKAPDFFELLEKSKQTQKDSMEVLTFNGFSEEKTETFKCSFDVEKYRTRLYEDEYGLNEYIELASLTNYVYKNQKIVFKSIRIKKDLKKEVINIKNYNRDEEVLDIYYYQNGKPRRLYSKLAKTIWFFDKKGNIDKVSYDELGNILNYFYLEEKKEFILDNAKFTLKEHLKIREDLLKIIHNTGIVGKDFDYFTVSDWKILNKTKKYLKKLFNIDFDLYCNGMSYLSKETYLISEFGEFYFLTPYWKELKEQQEYYNKK
ncbi:hypothetical protein [Flavobacterium tegetincola]|uniref:hypothetical protein n=1 Tax=Flavobacterium tegetincola TaxID=150172 RepID=UPI00041A2646|nr:hypothetical protein [Flavobacterium tegetincola]